MLWVLNHSERIYFLFKSEEDLRKNKRKTFSGYFSGLLNEICFEKFDQSNHIRCDQLRRWNPAFLFGSFQLNFVFDAFRSRISTRANDLVDLFLIELVVVLVLVLVVFGEQTGRIVRQLSTRTFVRSTTSSLRFLLLFEFFDQFSTIRHVAFGFPRIFRCGIT